MDAYTLGIAQHTAFQLRIALRWPNREFECPPKSMGAYTTGIEEQPAFPIRVDFVSLAPTNKFPVPISGQPSRCLLTNRRCPGAV